MGRGLSLCPGSRLPRRPRNWGEALADYVDALREYAQDWEDHLHAAPNHRMNWALVQLVDLSTDGQLTTWLTGSVA